MTARGRPLGMLDGLALAVLVGGTLLLASVCSGCGASSISMHTSAAQITAISLGGAARVATDARDHALDSVEAAHPVRGEARDAALDAEAERWRPLGQAIDAAREAVLSWVASIQAAATLGAEGVSALLPQLVSLAARAVLLYDRIASLARGLGADVPALPAVVASLARAMGGG